MSVRVFVLVAVSVGLLGPLAASVSGEPAAYADRSRVERLLAAMTVDEKLALLRGGVHWLSGPVDPDSVGEDGYIPGVPRLGIPPLRLTDGPAGVRITQPTTALPAPVSLAATFSPTMASDYGKVLGREAYATTIDVLYAPMVNLVRVPQAGRNFETLGEDPFVVAALAVAETRGIQSEGVIATPKHFAENNQESQRHTINVNIDERSLREMELRGFETVVKAGAGSLMCAYNKVNGVPACQSPELLTRILRKEWGFSGWVLSDYGANHSSTTALQAGLDMEFMSEWFAALKPTIEAGDVPVASLDEAVRHILTTMDRFGRLRNASARGARVLSRSQIPIDVEASARVSLDVAERGAVLLKNEGALPLRQDDLRSLAVIGPAAGVLLASGEGSSHITGRREREKSPLTALRERAGADAQITYSPGIDLDGVLIPASVLSPPEGGGTGLLRTDSVTGTTQLDPQIDFTGQRRLPPHSNLTWTGKLTVASAGEYEIKVQTNPKEDHQFIGGIGTLTLDGKLIAATIPLPGKNLDLMTTVDGMSNASARVTLTTGAHTIEVVGTTAGLPPYPASESPLQIRLAWVTPQMRRNALDAAVAAAKSARSVLVFAHDESTEGYDRPNLSLPLEQDQLITAVARANPRTTVVLFTGDSVLMPWLDQVNGVLEMWYPGQEGGYATADLLLGKANPGGKLPVTFPRNETELPSAAPERYPGVDGQESYSEGVFLGYRWYDAHNEQPLFPFGHGLSYTRFRYSDLTIQPSKTGLNVSFRVSNSGKVAGIEVPQVYLGPPDGQPVPMASRQLVGFEAIKLAPGESRRLSIPIGVRELSYWSVATHGWVVAAGKRAVVVGSSSRDLRLQAVTTVPTRNHAL